MATSADITTTVEEAAGALARKIKETEKRTKRKVTAVVFTAKQDEEGEKGAEGATKSLTDEDLFRNLRGVIVKPTLDPVFLGQVVEWSIAVSASIEAMEVNVGGLGWQPVSRVPDDRELTDAQRKEMADERFKVENLMLNWPRNDDAVLMSLETWRRQARRQREATGGVFIEVIRNRVGGWIASKVLPSWQMRMTHQDKGFTKAKVPRPKIGENRIVTWDQAEQSFRFRRYVQAGFVATSSFTQKVTTTLSTSTRQRWFKSLWDPRVLDNTTGEQVDADKVKNFDGKGNAMPEERRASEVIYLPIRSLTGPYGTPRWIGAITNAIGAREADEVNLFTLRNNNVPSMILTVSNGVIDQDSVDRIRQYVENHAKGNANYSTFLVLQAESEFEGESSGQAKIDVIPLTDEQMRDALFQNYVEQSEARQAKSFRIPAMFSGDATGLNKAVAEILRRLADEQVFDPERREEDHFFNYTVLADRGIRYWLFSSLTPTVTDNKELIAMLVAAERTGGITPQISRAIVEDVFPAAQRAAPIPDSVNPTEPFSLTLAAAVQNLSDPVEPNQQGPPVMGPVDPEDAIKSQVANELAKRIADQLVGDDPIATLKNLQVFLGGEEEDEE